MTSDVSANGTNGVIGAIGLHEVLLWLAGRVDDDLLGWARELIAVGEDDQAVELITATLIADRVALPLPLRDWAVERSRALQLEPDAEQALAPADEDEPAHSFVGELAAAAEVPDATEARLRAAIAGAADRYLGTGSWWLAWRLTPAGTAPGPLPHPVILVELTPDTVTSAEVVAYQVADAVQRADLTASVEVFLAGATLPDYHRVALREARGEVPAPLPQEPLGAQTSTAEPAPYEEPVPEPAESWSDEWVTGEWSESPASRQLAGLSDAELAELSETELAGLSETELARLSDTEKVLLAELQHELTEREARYKAANGGPSSSRPDIADPPGLAG